MAQTLRRQRRYQIRNNEAGRCIMCREPVLLVLYVNVATKKIVKKKYLARCAACTQKQKDNRKKG